MNRLFAHRFYGRLQAAVLLGGVVLMLTVSFFAPISVLTVHAATHAGVSDTAPTEVFDVKTMEDAPNASGSERTRLDEILLGSIGIAVAVLLAALAWAVRVRGWKKKDGSPTSSAA